jgi:hypothetical protein
MASLISHKNLSPWGEASKLTLSFTFVILNEVKDLLFATPYTRDPLSAKNIADTRCLVYWL